MLKQQLWWHQQLCNTCIKHLHWKQNIWKLYYLILNSCLIWSWWASAHWIVQRFVEFLICGVVPLLCGMFRHHVHLHPTYTLKNIVLCVCVELFWKNLFYIEHTSSASQCCKSVISHVRFPSLMLFVMVLDPALGYVIYHNKS